MMDTEDTVQQDKWPTIYKDIRALYMKLSTSFIKHNIIL